MTAAFDDGIPDWVRPQRSGQRQSADTPEAGRAHRPTGEGHRPSERRRRVRAYAHGRWERHRHGCARGRRGSIAAWAESVRQPQCVRCGCPRVRVPVDGQAATHRHRPICVRAEGGQPGVGVQGCGRSARYRCRRGRQGPFRTGQRSDRHHAALRSTASGPPVSGPCGGQRVRGWPGTAPWS